MENPLDNLVTDPNAKSLNHSQIIETQAVRYLCGSYRRALRLADKLGKKSKYLENIQKMKEIIIQNLITAFREPDFYVGQNLQMQLSDMILGCFEIENDFLEILSQLACQAKKHPLLQEKNFSSCFGGNSRKYQDHFNYPVLHEHHYSIAIFHLMFRTCKNIYPSFLSKDSAEWESLWRHFAWIYSTKVVPA